MAKKDVPKQVGGDNIQVSVGDNATDLAIGKNIEKITTHQSRNEITENDLAQIRELFTELRKQVSENAPVEKKDAAIERVGELEEAILADNPDITTIGYIRNWFLKYAPQLTGTITNILVNPIVNRVVETAGNLVEGALKQRLGLG